MDERGGIQATHVGIKDAPPGIEVSLEGLHNEDKAHPCSTAFPEATDTSYLYSLLSDLNCYWSFYRRLSRCEGWGLMIMSYNGHMIAL
jgi:hypothetical protein